MWIQLGPAPFNSCNDEQRVLNWGINPTSPFVLWTIRFSSREVNLVNNVPKVPLRLTSIASSYSL